MKSTDYIFPDLMIVQDERHLKYGTDALLLSAFARGGSKKRAVDLGCGNGVIALCLAKANKAQSVVGIELQESSAELAKESVKLNGLEGAVEIRRADLRNVPSCDCGAFDYAVSNPPYMKTHHGKKCELDEKEIARHEVGCDINSLCAAASKYVKFGGELFIVYRPDRISDLFCALRENRFEPKRLTFVCARPELAPCLVLVEAKSEGAVGCNVTPVFYISDSEGNTTEKMKAVYGGGSI